MYPSLLALLRACAVAAVAFGAGTTASAQPAHGTLAGVVRSEEGSLPIVGAVIEIQTLGRHTVSDSTGHFRIEDLIAGEFRLDMRALGFHAVTLLVRIRPETTSVVDVAFKAVPLPAEEVESTGLRRGDERLRGFHQRRSSGFGRFITRADIERRDVTETKELLRGIPGVRLVGSRVQMASSMSSPWCAVQYFVDAIHIVGAPVDFLAQIRPRDIEGIEVYRGPAETPPDFSRGGAHCGVIVIWTRTPGGGR